MNVGPGLQRRTGRAYLVTYHGPHGDAPAADSAVTAPVDQSGVGRLVSPAMLAAHSRLGSQRSIGETKVAVYAADDPTGVVPPCSWLPTRAPCSWTPSRFCCTGWASPTSRS